MDDHSEGSPSIRGIEARYLRKGCVRMVASISTWHHYSFLAVFWMVGDFRLRLVAMWFSTCSGWE